MIELEKVPEGWYEKMYLAVLHISDNVMVFRQEDRTGGEHQETFGLIKYICSIDGISFMIPKNVFLTLSEKYEIYYMTTYSYLNENYKTYDVHETYNGIFSYEDEIV